MTGSRDHTIENGRRADDDARTAPAFDPEAAPLPRRRAEDFGETNGSPRDGAERRSRGQRRRALARRFRKPLIGLGMIGAAAPMGKFRQAEAPREPAGPQPAEDETDTAWMAGTDAEESVVGRVAELRARGERNLAVLNAVERFGISRDLAEDIYDVAQEEGVEPTVAYGLVRTESTFRERAVSHVGARGLTQVMPRTARWLIPGTTSQDLFDRRTNLRLGFRYLDQLIQKYRGDMKLALTAYNRGPGTVDRVLARGGNPDNGYAAKVLRP
jgi:hypothetical protein